ncbi:MAG: transcription termination factor NusA [Lachnospiraceae bacterium]|nr:transcription termination factor NusA [Lachnospiraceae bacterium]
MNKELLEALEIFEKERDIPKEVMFEAIEDSLLKAYNNHFGKSDNVKVEIDRETGDYRIYAVKEVVKTEEDVTDPVTQITLVDAKLIDKKAKEGDTVNVEFDSKDFGRIAASNAKNVITQKIREEEHSAIIKKFKSKEKKIVTGVVRRFVGGKNISIDLGKAEGFLAENEQVPTERFKVNDRIKVYVLEVKDSSKGPRINVSRTHPELVKMLFEQEIAEVADGTVEIKAIAREAGSRTKIAVWSNNPDVDPVGACVGMNGARVNAINDELRGEKIDIIEWNENEGLFIENALSPANVVFTFADSESKEAKVVVPDNQLSLAIGMSGQNARLAARLTGFKIDIKSEEQAKDAEGFRLEDYEGYDDEYDEEYEEEYEESYEETTEDSTEE